ncbi:hypothetical protein DES53_105141 [Roseimicrobium gellanilyticum]|uniref:Uncharacterized protein n=1 Tax=Roseimicrobium gellanilyticum TaxID=748857 RepID=A0A366HN42_9BACT|nr:hypothetical protein [Roseimicrobium gellanilyticum]RBP43742.1 hypothetical protein DES53_105141 [Roseimicrobium gellanilyticum]
MLRFAALVLLPSLCCIAAEVEKSPGAPGDFPKPAKGSPWKHEESGIQLPQKLGGLTMQGGRRHDTPDLGVSVRYASEDGSVRAEVNVYPCKQPHGTEEEKLKVVSGEAAAVLGDLKKMEKEGACSKLEYGEGESWKVSTGPNEKTAFVEVPLSCVVHESAGKAARPVSSRLGVTVVSGYFVKVRYIYPADRKLEGDPASVVWVKKVRMAISEPFLRPKVEEALKKYHQDPLSDEGVTAAGSVAAYAEESPFVSLNIPLEIVQWGGVCEKVAPDSRLHLLRAFIVGGVEASMKSQSDDEVIAAGMGVTAELYQRLKKQHTELNVDDMEKLVEAVDARKGVEFYKNLDSISKKGG